ncbi:FAD-dependent oxidoreductase [Mesorhizobium sp. CAU 1741]|uniref:FAD-dependent oxidoreductase n=1 Tax=Mesorhizobium sp. CAU 1741 TaxID=3140366 RepID=UPI00325A45F3
MTAAGRVAVVGAGIAGLTAALAFARHGFEVVVFERSPTLEEIGAGLQLSPNATRILARLGVIERLLDKAVQPEGVVLRRADSLREVATVPLGEAALQRWGAPYLTIHRADLQQALVDMVAASPAVDLRTGRAVDSLRRESDGRASLVLSDDSNEGAFDLVVGADGVWSRLRDSVPGARDSRYSGYVAWRATVAATGGQSRWLPAHDSVTSFMHPRFHLVAYPLRGGRAVNFVAVTRGPEPVRGWSGAADTGLLLDAMRGAADELQSLAAMAGSWTTWPLHDVDPNGPWTDGSGLALVGDAAHAMTPFAAQGAAMAIEDAATLARLVAKQPGDKRHALERYEQARQRRVARVAKRGSFNRFVWHARGPVAFGRDMVLASRPAGSLASDMDWLYGFDEAASQ